MHIRWLLRLGIGALLLVVLVLAAGWWMLSGSLPQLEGEITSAGLGRSVRIQRDALGVPTMLAGSRADLAYATGFVHAQDRFFQMDLLRRSGGGELAELLGKQLIPTDKHLRRHRFRSIAGQVVAAASTGQQTILSSYAAGVNAAMAQWRTPPFEYLILGSTPRPWTMEDSILVAYAMYITLNDESGELDRVTRELRDALPEAVVHLLQPEGTHWDAPVIGEPAAASVPPGPDIIDLRASPSASVQSRSVIQTSPAVGSNAWALSGERTASGRALIANDMHLGLAVPNTWYRVRMQVDAQEGARDLSGITIPGLPVLVGGSNGYIAWGLTNSYGDWTDLVDVRTDGSDGNRYLSSNGPRPYDMHTEVIRVRDSDDATLVVKGTEWGPLVDADSGGRPLALAWTAHRPDATNLDILALETSRTVDEAVTLASRVGMPVLNFIVGDREGHIGWTLMGRIPQRDGEAGAWVPAEDYPRIVDPPGGTLWSANARMTEGEALRMIGDGGYDLGARARQIRDGIAAVRDARPADMLKIQLDDRALFLARWQDLLLGLLDEPAVQGKPLRADAREWVKNWSGRADTDDVGYRIVREFRRNMRDEVFEWLIAPASEKAPDTEFMPSDQFEDSLWLLITEQPPNLLDADYGSWREALLDIADMTLAQLLKRCDTLAQCTWGRRNTLDMRHPLSQALGRLSRWLDMPMEPLPGDDDMPRVQSTSFGASERYALSPGQENEGYFHMPGGQSGHPLSPFYRAGHEAWVKGEPTPFLPGPAVHELLLKAD